MNELLNISIGVFVLLLGIPIGDFLAKQTKEELGPGKKWFKRIIIISLIWAFIFLILGNDALLFSFLFIAIVTSRSLGKGKKKGRRGK